MRVWICNKYLFKWMIRIKTQKVYLIILSLLFEVRDVISCWMNLLFKMWFFNCLYTTKKMAPARVLRSHNSKNKTNIRELRFLELGFSLPSDRYYPIPLDEFLDKGYSLWTYCTGCSYGGSNLNRLQRRRPNCRSFLAKHCTKRLLPFPNGGYIQRSWSWTLQSTLPNMKYPNIIEDNVFFRPN